MPPVPRGLRIGSPPLPPQHVKTKQGEDAEFEAAKEASKRQIVEDEAKRWAKVLAEVV